jgi:hypothetical protein
MLVAVIGSPAGQLRQLTAHRCQVAAGALAVTAGGQQPGDVVVQVGREIGAEPAPAQSVVHFSVGLCQVADGVDVGLPTRRGPDATGPSAVGQVSQRNAEAGSAAELNAAFTRNRLRCTSALHREVEVTTVSGQALNSSRPRSAGRPPGVMPSSVSQTLRPRASLIIAAASSGTGARGCSPASHRSTEVIAAHVRQALGCRPVRDPAGKSLVRHPGLVQQRAQAQVLLLRVQVLADWILGQYMIIPGAWGLSTPAVVAGTALMINRTRRGEGTVADAACLLGLVSHPITAALVSNEEDGESSRFTRAIATASSWMIEGLP